MIHFQQKMSARNSRRRRSPAAQPVRPGLGRVAGPAGNQPTSGRLSRPAAEALVPMVAESLADRLEVGVPVGSDADNLDAQDRGWKTAFSELTRAQQLEFARYALNAALEALDSEPTLAAALLPGTTSTIRAQIAGGCVAEQSPHAPGFIVAEIDIETWEQLLRADERAVPCGILEPREAAERRRTVLSELGIPEQDLSRYRNDLRVTAAVPDLGSAGR